MCQTLGAVKCPRLEYGNPEKQKDALHPWMQGVFFMQTDSAGKRLPTDSAHLPPGWQTYRKRGFEQLQFGCAMRNAGPAGNKHGMDREMRTEKERRTPGAPGVKIKSNKLQMRFQGASVP